MRAIWAVDQIGLDIKSIDPYRHAQFEHCVSSSAPSSVMDAFHKGGAPPARSPSIKFQSTHAWWILFRYINISDGQNAAVAWIVCVCWCAGGPSYHNAPAHQQRCVFGQTRVMHFHKYGPHSPSSAVLNTFTVEIVRTVYFISRSWINLIRFCDKKKSWLVDFAIKYSRNFDDCYLLEVLEEPVS
jgi:hypothetical protein